MVISFSQGKKLRSGELLKNLGFLSCYLRPFSPPSFETSNPPSLKIVYHDKQFTSKLFTLTNFLKQSKSGQGKQHL
jgi:hypothetical protein